MKELLKTKSFWWGLICIFYGIANLFLADGEQFPEFVAMGLAIIFLRDGIRKNVSRQE